MNRTAIGFLLMLATLLQLAFDATPWANSQIIYLPMVQAAISPIGLQIANVSDNRASYPGDQIPKYEKFEITFQVHNPVAQNPQFPFDPSPPPGIDLSNPAYQGISVDAIFTPDNWQTTYAQPAFYFQEFIEGQVGNKEWFYPTSTFSWKVRFSPHVPGTWQYKLTAQDASGFAETTPRSFTVTDSNRHGFIKVSSNDARYFEFDDGTYFPGLGYNMNYNRIGWVNPRLDNEANFQTMNQNGIQLIRIWMSQWAIFGSAWNPWHAQDPFLHGSYIPHHGLNFDEIYPGSETSMRIRRSTSQWDSACMVLGMFQAPPAVRQNTDYHVRVRYKLADISGPLDVTAPFGFTVKTGGWLWSNDESQRCYSPNTGTLVPAIGGHLQHVNQVTGDWDIWEGVLNTGGADFLPRLFLVLENSISGSVYVDYIWVQERLSDGTLGPNIVSKPDMNHHRYFEQRNSYAFDKMIELADQYGIYLRPVILEKNEWLQNRFYDDGSTTRQFCNQEERKNLPPSECPNNDWFYGKWRQPTKSRWLQQAWWRYLQARWGYSTAIHSWELLNEGDPANDRHYAQADEFGNYMHCGVFGIDVGDINGSGDGNGDKCLSVYDHPNDHLVSTSNWHSFPASRFWANADYPNVDFADLHRYIRDPDYDGSGDAEFYDAALATYNVSTVRGAYQPNGAGKPVIRGETGFVVDGSGPASGQLLSDTQGIWLHNFVWGQINPGGLLESYWYENYHIYRTGYDHRPVFRTYYEFIKDIPLNNGNYTYADAQTSQGSLRVWGQKDLANNRAHLWIQNADHTWKNVVDAIPIAPVSGTVVVAGFTPNTSLTVEWWDTYSGSATLIETVTTDAAGALVLPVTSLTADIAARIDP